MLQIKSEAGTLIHDLNQHGHEWCVSFLVNLQLHRRAISDATPDDGDGTSMNVKGRDLITGLPKEISISQRQIAEALAEPVAQIIDTIKRALE